VSADVRSVTAPRRAAALALCAGALASAVAAPAASAADTATPTPRLLGGLLPNLGLGGGGTTPAPVDPNLVTTLLTQITGTGLPVDQLTAVVTDLLATGVDPNANVIEDLIDTVVSTVTTPTQVSDLVDQLLAGGAETGLVGGMVGELLGSVGATAEQVTQVVGALLADGLPTDATALTGILDALSGGAAPTGALLSPVADLVDQLAAKTALPADVRSDLQALAQAIRDANVTEVPAAVLETVGGVLGTVAGTASLPAPVVDVLGSLAGLFGKTKPGTTTTPTPGAGAPAAGGPTATTAARPRLQLTSAMRARISRVVAAKDRRKLKVTVRCPSVAVLGCATSVQGRFAGRAVGKPVAKILLPGQTTVLTLRMPAATTRTLKRRGGRVGARALTYLGTNLQPTASRTATVRRATTRSKATRRAARRARR
jgi:hypothetical protein